MKELILDKSKRLFFSHGLKTTTMDDIARAAGVSKKTLYQNFASKNDIFIRVLQYFLQRHQQELVQCKEQAADAVDEVFKTAEVAEHYSSLVSQRFFYDLERSFPDVWLLITKHRQEVLLPSIIDNLHKGIEDEYYRQEINIPFIGDLRVQQITTAFNQMSFNGKMQRDNKLMFQLSEFYLHAITTAKGKKLINKYLNVNNEKPFSN